GVSWGAVENLPFHGVLLRRAATTYSLLAMGLPVKDATAGFRVYTAEVLRRLDLRRIISQGYCFQIDMALRVYRAGGAITEVPITFIERTEGESKMSGHIVAEALWRVTAWGVRYRVEQLARIVRRKN